MWMKYRHKFSNGIDKEWSWKDLGVSSLKEARVEAKEISFELENEYNWSEHYRGLEYKIVKYPPRNIIVSEIESTKQSIRLYKNRIKELKEILEMVKG